MPGNKAKTNTKYRSVKETLENASWLQALCRSAVPVDAAPYSSPYRLYNAERLDVPLEMCLLVAKRGKITFTSMKDMSKKVFRGRTAAK